MEQKEAIALDEVERITYKFLAGRTPRLHSINIAKANLTAVLDMLLYQVEGTYEVKGGILSSKSKLPFKIQVNARDGAVVGFEE